MRNDYTLEENPIQQVYNYVRTIRAGEATSAKGRPLPKLDVTPFYAYIICDITPKLIDFMKDHGFIGAPDGQMFYRYNDGHRVYIEVMSFEKLLSDSKKRNQAFFPWPVCRTAKLQNLRLRPLRRIQPARAQLVQFLRRRRSRRRLLWRRPARRSVNLDASGAIELSDRSLAASVGHLLECDRCRSHAFLKVFP